MTIEDARQIIMDYHRLSNPDEVDEIGYVEALEFMIDKTKDSEYMTELGWFYCTKKRFDMEIKYFEMAAECSNARAAEELGYMWYYGQHGEQDYEKAFKYFSIGAEGGDKIDAMWCRYKLADMYRFGCYVEKDEKKYRKMIEEAFEEIEYLRNLDIPFPEIAYRKAGLLLEDGEEDEAAFLLLRAKFFMGARLSEYIFWGHVEMMGRIINKLYELTSFDKENFDFYDLFYLTKQPGLIRFKYAGRPFELEVADISGSSGTVGASGSSGTSASADEPSEAAADVTEAGAEGAEEAVTDAVSGHGVHEKVGGEDLAIRFEGKWYRSFAEFCERADLGKDKIVKNYDALYDWEVA